MTLFSITPCQQSESLFQKPNTDPYGYQIPLSHSPEYESGGQLQHPIPSNFGQYGRYDHNLLWKPESRHKSSDTNHRYLEDTGPRLSTTNTANSGSSGGHFEWVSSRRYGYDSLEPRPTETGRSSISNRSDATGSERSDNTSSPRSIADDLQGLSLGDHISSKLVPLHGASCRSHRNDPVLGNVQRHHDTLVVSRPFYHHSFASTIG